MTAASDQLAAALAKPKRHKYRAKPVTVDGVWFASGREADRWSVLRIMERAGMITDLVRQPRYPIVINGIKICEYRGDFAYRNSLGEPCTEDVKGVHTDVFRIKQRLVKAVLGIEIIIT